MTAIDFGWRSDGSWVQQTWRLRLPQLARATPLQPTQGSPNTRQAPTKSSNPRVGYSLAPLTLGIHTRCNATMLHTPTIGKQTAVSTTRRGQSLRISPTPGRLNFPLMATSGHLSTHPIGEQCGPRSKTHEVRTQVPGGAKPLCIHNLPQRCYNEAALAATSGYTATR